MLAHQEACLYATHVYMRWCVCVCVCGGACVVVLYEMAFHLLVALGVLSSPFPGSHRPMRDSPVLVDGGSRIQCVHAIPAVMGWNTRAGIMSDFKGHSADKPSSQKEIV